VVHRGDREIGTADAAARQPEGLERLGAGHLMDEMEIDVEEIRLADRPMDDVTLPDLLGQRLRLSQPCPPPAIAADEPLRRPSLRSSGLFHIVERSPV
jgi:hypothetical protein